MDDATAAAYRAMGYIRRQTKGRPLYSEAEAAGVCRDCQNGECDNCKYGNPTGYGCTWDAHMKELGIDYIGADDV